MNLLAVKVASPKVYLKVKLMNLAYNGTRDKLLSQPLQLYSTICHPLFGLFSFTLNYQWPVSKG